MNKTYWIAAAYGVGNKTARNKSGANSQPFGYATHESAVRAAKRLLLGWAGMGEEAVNSHQFEPDTEVTIVFEGTVVWIRKLEINLDNSEEPT